MNVSIGYYIIFFETPIYRAGVNGDSQNKKGGLM
jgi:hypothetical protein